MKSDGLVVKMTSLCQAELPNREKTTLSCQHRELCNKVKSHQFQNCYVCGDNSLFLVGSHFKETFEGVKNLAFSSEGYGESPENVYDYRSSH